MVEKLIEEEENRLLDFIKSKVVKSIKSFCQWRLCFELYSIQRKKEVELIEEYSIELYQWIAKNAPLHSQSLFYHPLLTLMNDCSWDYYQTECAKWHKEALDRNPLCFSPCITYKDFEEEGFSREFSKRVVEKLEEVDLIKRKRGIFGYNYTITDIKSLENEIFFEKKAIELTQQDFHDFTEMDWLFDNFHDEFLEETFNKYKSIIFNEIESNIEYKDSKAI